MAASRRTSTSATAQPDRPHDFDATFWWALLAFAAALLLAYQPAWHGELLWDDDGHVTREGLRSLEGLWRIWFEPGATQQYYPVVHSAFWIQSMLWGDHTFGYHIVNVLLHAASAALLMAVLRRLQIPGAALAGALFALHPVQVESVAWITELKNTLSGFWYFLAALYYLRFDGTRQRSLYRIATALFVLALLSKSVTATLPVGLLIILWWQRGRIALVRDVKPLGLWLGLGLAAGLMTIFMESTFIGARGAAYDLSLVERTLVAGRAVWFYLASLLWPANLTFNYVRWTIDATAWTQWLGPALVAATFAVLWVVRKRFRAPLAIFAFFVATLAPALGFVNVYPFVYSFVADHFQYLACAAIFAGVAAASTAAAQRLALPRAGRVATAGLLLALLFGLTWRYSHIYVSKAVLYGATIERNPESWLAHGNLSALLLEQEPPRPDEALAHARDAARLAPQQAGTHVTLAAALAAKGERAPAIDAYMTALQRATPDELRGTRMTGVYAEVARLLEQEGRLPEAAAMLAQAAGAAPTSLERQINAAIVQLKSGNADEAARQLALVLQRAPDNLDARYALGLALEQLRQFAPAASEFAIVVRGRPSDGAAREHLARSLHASGRTAEAVEHYQSAIALGSGTADAHNDLGAALAQLGRFREAEVAFREALSRRPGDPGIAANLARVRELIKSGRGAGR